MSTRRIATALGAAVLLFGAPASSALAAQDGPGKPDKPQKVKECSDGVDNDGDTFFDFKEDGTGDPDCGSPNDNSESPEPAEEPGGGTPGAPALPPELQAIVDEVLAALQPEEEEPCEGPDCPSEEEPVEEPAPDPAAELQAAIDEVLGGLPSAPPSPEELQAAVQEVVDQLPSPPAV